MTPQRKQIHRARMVEAWRMRARGWSQVRIARELDLSQGYVSKLLKVVERLELRRFAGESERHKIVQTVQLEHLVEEAFDAWHRSKTPLKRAASKTATGGEGEGPGDEVRTTEVVERDGDTGYLYAAMQALGHLRSLWGLDVAPALNDAATSITKLTADLFGRGAAYEQRRQASEVQAGDPPGADGAAHGGAAEVPDGPQPVQ